MMKKSLWLMVGLSMAHLIAGQAQSVTSNAIGFVNIRLGPGFNLIANPLNGTNNQLRTILPLPDSAEGTTIYRFKADQSGFGDAISFYRSGVAHPSSDRATGPDPARCARRRHRSSVRRRSG